LVSVGGGIIVVPFLIWCNMPLRHAIGTAAAIGFPIAIGGTMPASKTFRDAVRADLLAQAADGRLVVPVAFSMMMIGLFLIVARRVAVNQVIGYLVLSVRFGFPQGYWVFVGLDAVAVLLPHWFTGVREYLKQDKLIIKISLLERMMGELSAPSDAQVFPMLALAETAGGKQVPEDARLLVKIVGAPQEFYGMQVQVSVNTVQGKDYPYLYCVLIGKAGAKLLRGYEEFLPATDTSFLGSISSFLGLGGGQAKLVCEPDSRDDVDILVVRQEALRNTGFSTGPAAAAYIVNTCLNIARGLLQKPAPPKSPTSVKV